MREAGQVKRCRGCSGEIPDDSSVCAACGAPAAGAAAPSHDDPASTALVLRRSPNPDRNVVQAPTHRRELLLAAGGAMAAAVVTFTLLSLRGGSSATLAAASSEPLVRHAADRRAVTSAVHRWSGDNRKFWLGNGRGAAFELSAENSVQTWFGPLQPALVVRCASGATETFVYTRSPVKIEPTDARTVTVSIDAEPARTEHWSTSDDHAALFAPDGPAFAERLMHAHTLRFGYSPHNSSDVVAQFSVAGLGELMGSAARECRPKK